MRKAKRAAIQSVLKTASRDFLKVGIPTPKLDAEILLSYAIGESKEFLYTYPEYRLNKKQTRSFNKIITRRFKREPVAYIINKKEFCGYEFYVDKRVLIPRPITEQLVEKVLKMISSASQQDSKFIIVDVGTGSGCIIISIVKKLIQQNRALKKITFIGIDVSKNALKVADLNAKKNGVSEYILFYKGNLLTPLYSKAVITKGSTAIITANLPYITSSLYQTLQPEIILYEPKTALLTPDNNALHYYAKLDRQIEYLKNKTNATIYTHYEAPFTV